MVWSFLEKYPILGGPRQVWSKSRYQTNTGMYVPLSIYHLIYIYGNVQNVQMDFQYRSLAKQMMIFEKNWVIEWAQTVNQQATFYLKQVYNIFETY